MIKRGWGEERTEGGIDGVTSEAPYAIIRANFEIGKAARSKSLVIGSNVDAP